LILSRLSINHFTNVTWL